MERKLLEEQNKVLKNLMEESKKEKQREIQCHMEFLQVSDSNKLELNTFIA